MTGTRQLLRRSLHRLAATQAGYFTAAQAIDIGYSHQAQKYHVDQGNWTRVDRGIFRIPEWPTGINDTFARWILWSKHRAVISHDSAASLHGLGVANPARVHLTVPVGFRMNDDRVVLYPRPLADRDIVDIDGSRVTTVLRTVLDMIDIHFDEELVGEVVDDALDRGAIVKTQIANRLDELSAEARHRGERLLGLRAP